MPDSRFWFKEQHPRQKNRTVGYHGLRRFAMIFASLTDLAALARLHFFENSLCCGQSCDGDTEWAAAHICQADAVAELHRRWLAAVFAADAELDIGTRLAAFLNGDLHKLAHA